VRKDVTRKLDERTRGENIKGREEPDVYEKKKGKKNRKGCRRTTGGRMKKEIVGGALEDSRQKFSNRWTEKRDLGPPSEGKGKEEQKGGGHDFKRIERRAPLQRELLKILSRAEVGTKKQAWGSRTGRSPLLDRMSPGEETRDLRRPGTGKERKEKRGGRGEAVLLEGEHSYFR